MRQNIKSCIDCKWSKELDEHQLLCENKNVCYSRKYSFCDLERLNRGICKREAIYWEPSKVRMTKKDQWNLNYACVCEHMHRLRKDHKLIFHLKMILYHIKHIIIAKNERKNIS